MLRKILVNFSARFGVAVINFLVLLLTTNYLGSGARGEISLIALGLNIVHLISDIAGGPSMVYLVPRVSTFTLLALGYVWSVCCVTLIGIPLVYFNLIPQEFGTDILLLSLLVSLHSVHMNILLGKEQIRTHSLLLFLQAMVLITAMFVYIRFFGGDSTQVFITGAYLAYGAVLLCSTFVLWPQIGAKQIENLRKIFSTLFRNGFFTQLASLTHQLSIRVNFYIIGAIPFFTFANNYQLSSKQAIGLYSTAISLAETILIFSQSVATVMMARAANVGEQERTRRLALQCSKLSLAITLPAIALFLLLPAEFYVMLLGKDFLVVKQVFVPLATGIAALSFGTVYSHYFSGMGKHYMNAVSGIVALCVTFSTAFYFIPRYGLEGASISAAMASSSMSLTIFLLFLFERGTSPKQTLRHFFSLQDWHLLKEQFRKLLKK